MKTYRKYGRKPYELLLVHGGPGATGSLRPVAEVLSKSIACIEVLNNSFSVEAQIDEVYRSIKENNLDKAIVAGHSWGAWLGMLFSERYPDLVKKLILIACPAFDIAGREYTARTRMNRLNDGQKIRLEKLSIKLRESHSKHERNDTFKRMGEIIREADSFSPLQHAESAADYEIFSRVWPEADKLRETGELSAALANIKCPVFAVHGNYDPHPAEAVKKVLNSKVETEDFYLLPNCGHEPWNEKYARKDFFRILKHILK
mgnify:CR=1 FL=1